MKTVLKVALGMMLGGLVLIAGCAALIGAGADKVSKDLDRQQQAHAISLAKFRGVKHGWTERQVIGYVGKRPQDRQEFEGENALSREPANSSCIYYNRAAGRPGDLFQFCFEQGRLRSKNSY